MASGTPCAQDIVDALNRHGGLVTPIKRETLRSYLYRYRKKNRSAPAERVSPGGGIAGVDAGGPAAQNRPLVRNASDLKRLRNQEIDLDALSRVGRSQRGG